MRVLHSDEEGRASRRGVSGYCGIEDVCTAACDKCLLNGASFKKDFANPDNVLPQVRTRRAS